MDASPREVRVQSVSYEAAGVLSLRLRDPDMNELPDWAPGAHLDLTLPSGRVRQYSLCGDPRNLSSYKIAVLREPNGRGGSRELHETALVGHTLEISGPRNRFDLEPADRYVFLAGGIGITPIVTMCEQADRAGIPWQLLYGGRSRATMAFRERLSALAGEVLVQPDDECGMPDWEKAVAGLRGGALVYACGPAAMLSAVETYVERHLGRDFLRLERFAGSGMAPVAPTPGAGFEVELRRSGQVVTVEADRSILDAVLEVVPGAPHSCREGWCGTCEVRVLAGEPEHLDDLLTDAERAAGDRMMICVGRSKSPRLVLDL